MHVLFFFFRAHVLREAFFREAFFFAPASFYQVPFVGRLCGQRLRASFDRAFRCNGATRWIMWLGRALVSVSLTDFALCLPFKACSALTPTRWIFFPTPQFCHGNLEEVRMDLQLELGFEVCVTCAASSVRSSLLLSCSSAGLQPLAQVF